MNVGQSHLFSPVKLGGYELSNRIVMAAMTRSRTAGAIPNDLNVLYYRQRATAGLIVAEGAAPSHMGLGYVDMPGLFTAAQALGWRRVADAVHAEGSRIFAQLMFVGRVSHPLSLGGATPLGPSAVQPKGTVFTREGWLPFVTPRAMLDEDIEAALVSYAAAAKLAVAVADLDGVEIHAANGYLPHQFLAPNANIRIDGWGGDTPGRARFLLEALDRTIDAIGGDRVGVRLGPATTYNDINDPDWPATYRYLIGQLAKRSFAYLHVAVPLPAAGSAREPDIAGLVRESFQGTVILNGSYGRDRAEADLALGRADLISFGTSFIANPDLPRRLRVGADLNQPDPATFYGGDEKGYVDYPALDEEPAQADASA